MISGVMDLLTRMERNRLLRRNKRRFCLLILLAIILVFISISHINNIYYSLVDATKTNKIFSIEKDVDTNTLGIVFFGEKIELPIDFFIEIRDRWKANSGK